MITYQNAIDLYNAVKMNTMNNIGTYDLVVVCNAVLKTNYNPEMISLRDLQEIYTMIDNYAMTVPYIQLSSLYLSLREYFVDPNLSIADRNGNPVTLRVTLPELPEDAAHTEEAQPDPVDVDETITKEEPPVENEDTKAAFDAARDKIKSMAKTPYNPKKSK